MSALTSYMEDATKLAHDAWYISSDQYSPQKGWWMQPIVPAVGVTAYILAKPLLVVLCKQLGTTGKSYPFFLFVVLHNFLLLSFSAMVFYESWAVVYDSYTNKGMMSTYCDYAIGEQYMWKAGMGRLGFLFYLSKYYEFLDTAILIVKQKKVSLLQSYHHAGAVLVMWGLCYTEASVVVAFVGLNSAIHTAMYFYYLLSACGIRLPGKSNITTAQIIQFFIGIFVTLRMFFMGEACQRNDQLIALAVAHVYVVPLIALFANFYIKSYKPVDSKKKIT